MDTLSISNHIGGVMIRVVISSAVDLRFEPLLGNLDHYDAIQVHVCNYATTTRTNNFPAF
jgi:hypothetical protein